MRVTALMLVVVAATLLGSVGRAAAEKVKTNQTTKVYAGPGEQRKVILKLKSGQNMTLVEQEGRWLKVRVHGRTGYVPRSKVDMADDGTIARNTRRRPFVDGRSRRRGFGGEAGPDDRIGADAVGEGQEDMGDDEGEEEDEEEEPRKRDKEVATRESRDDEEDEGDDEEFEDEGDEEEGDGEELADDEEEFEDEEDRRPTARVSKKVAALEFADPDSDEMFTARADDVLYPTGNTDGDWTEVETEEGDIGWIRTEYIESDSGGGGMGKRQIVVGARLGFMFIQQAMRTAGSENLKVPDNYNVGTSSVTLSLGGSYKMPFKKKYILGGELAYDYSKTLFGGIFYDPDGKDMPMPGVNTAVTIHNLTLRGMAGYDFKKKNGMAVFGRLGYRYQSFLVANYLDATKNPARIPQEVMKGPTLGAAFVMPKLTDKIGLEVALDGILFGGSLKQTKGLEDGGKPTLKAITLGAGVTYRWKKNMNLQAIYDLRYTAVDFGPPLDTSMRGHMGNNVKRTDIFHLLTVGITKPF
jgi:hypothetical protein